MENVTINLTVETIQKVIQNQFEDILKSSYSNPVRDLVTNAIKSHEGAINTLVNEIISEALTEPEFRKKMSDLVVQRLVESALKK